MGLTSTAIATLAVGITKALIKLWLDDRTVAIAAGQSATQILGRWIPDVLQRRKVERQFEVIGESVAESVGALFTRERVSISAGAQLAVADAVQRALDDPLLTPKGLVDADLDGERVAQALLRTAKPDPRDFGEAETALFERMLLESAIRTLRVIEELPNFKPTALGALLSRQTEIMAAVDKILTGFDRMLALAEQKNPERHAAAFEARYRAALEQKLDRVELFGIRAGTKRYPLTVAFVTLEAEREYDDDTASNEGAVHDVLGREGDRLWITGLAGAGKTTLLQWLAVQTALDDLPPALAAWSGRVPFFIRLRQFAEAEFPGPPAWATASLPALAGGVPDGWVNRQLNDGRALVLIDGIDEVPEERRGAFREWAEDLMAVYPDTVWVFSSRPLLDGGVELPGVHEIALRSMGPAQVATFIEHWHMAVGVESGDDAGGELTTLAAQLRARLAERPNLRRLITNPLLCAMVCALHRDQRALLPDGRRGLYEACCEMLLHSRDKQRSVAAGDASPLTYAQKRVLLTELAWHMLKNGLSMIDVRRMDDQFQKAMARLSIASSVTSVDLRRFMVERSGLLRMPLPGQVDFVHKSFLEFLAAGAMLAAGDIELVARHATESGWREVALHAASQARGAVEAGHLLSALLDRAEAEPAVRHQMVLLALAATNEAGELEPEIRARVEAAVEGLGRPSKVGEAAQWSAAGELVVPALKRFWEAGVSASEARAIIRVLAQVSTPEALNLVIRYASMDTQYYVRHELIHALRHVRPEQKGLLARSITPWLLRLRHGELLVDGMTVQSDAMAATTFEALATALAQAIGADRPTSLVLRHYPGARQLTIKLLEQFPAVTELVAPISVVPALSDRLDDFPQLKRITLYGSLCAALMAPRSLVSLLREPVGVADVEAWFEQLAVLCAGPVVVYADLDERRIDPGRLFAEGIEHRIKVGIADAHLQLRRLPHGFLASRFPLRGG